jgi:AcrR family transcriptional regulator
MESSMSKAFTVQEKLVIQERLQTAGRARFARFGLRKTTVEELAQAAGISKGAFYAFYASKEALYADIMERVETEMQATLLEMVTRSGAPTQRSFKEFLLACVGVLQTDPFLAGSTQELPHLILKLPEEKIRAGIEKDKAFVARLLSEWEKKGLRLTHGPEVISSLLRALVLLSLQRDEFDPRGYPGMLDLLAEAIAAHLVPADAGEAQHPDPCPEPTRPARERHSDGRDERSGRRLAPGAVTRAHGDG